MMYILNCCVLLHTGDLLLSADVQHLLDMHSRTSKATYGYYFTAFIERLDENGTAIPPDMYKTSADHVDELPYVFGYDLQTEVMLTPYEGQNYRIIDYLSLKHRNELIIMKILYM